MMHPTSAGIGLVRLGESSFVPANPENDLRGKDVYDPLGQRIGGVEDLYFDRQEREVRFLVPVEAVVEVAEDQVTIEPGRTEKVEGSAPFDTKVAPPSTSDPSEDYASPSYSDTDRTADRLDMGGYGSFGR
jgi:sporulation protein YlmC with PRC-barrel domain